MPLLVKHNARSFKPDADKCSKLTHHLDRWRVPEVGAFIGEQDEAPEGATPCSPRLSWGYAPNKGDKNSSFGSIQEESEVQTLRALFQNEALAANGNAIATVGGPANDTVAAGPAGTRKANILSPSDLG